MLLRLDVDYDYALEVLTQYSERKEALYIMNLTNKSWFSVLESGSFNVKSYSITMALNEVNKEVFLHVVFGGEAKTIIIYKHDFRHKKLKELLGVLTEYDLGYEILD